jgi:murein DD-endopeptidase MepM/ murein hydrolase activator NlpD
MAISPTISLGRVSKSTSNLRSTVSQTGKTTNVIKNTLVSGISKKRNLWNSTKIFKSKRDEFERRQSQKDLLFAPSILRRRGGARLLSQQDRSTSITDRLLGFVKYLTAGWLIGNLPSFIFLGEQFVGRLGTAGTIMSNYGDETLKVMKSIGSIFKSALKNLSAFDFSDRSGLMQSSITELTDALDDLGTGLSDALGVLFAPFKQLPKPGEEPSPTPTPTPPGAPAPSGGNSDFWTLVAVASREDGDAQGQADVAQSIYNRAKSGAYSGKTIRELIIAEGQYQPTWDRPNGPKNGTGKPNAEWFQITDAKSAAKAAGFKESTILQVAKNITNPTLQKEAAKFVAGRTDFKSAGTGKSPSIQRKGGDNWFGWEYGYRGTTVAPVPNLGVTQTPVPTPQTRVPPPPSGQRKLQKKDIFTKSLGKDVDYIEIGDVYLGRGGQHKGIDIRAPLGTYIALRADAEWVAYDFQPDGYGHVLDVWVPSYGVQLRFGHLIEKPARLSKIPAGTSFARVGSSGNSTGPHIHFEYDTQKGASRGGGAGDPDQYVRLLLLTKSPNKGKFSPAPKPSASLVPGAPQIPVQPEEAVEMQNNAYQIGLREGIVQERRGQKIVIIDDRGIQIPQKVMTSSGDTLSIQIDESALLNTFMKNKLLLDLNYV